MKKVTFKGKLFEFLGAGLILCVLGLSGCSNATGAPASAGTAPDIRPSSSAPSPATSPMKPTVVSRPSTTQSSASQGAAGKVTLSAVPTAQTVKSGDKFDIAIRINTAVPTRGLQCTLTWDPAKVQCDSVEDGNFYKSFADSNDLDASTLPQPLKADSERGQFPAGYDPLGLKQFLASISLEGGQAVKGSMPAPTGNGDVFVLHMTAKSGASGIETFEMKNVVIADSSLIAKELECTINNGQVSIQ